MSRNDAAGDPRELKAGHIRRLLSSSGAAIRENTTGFNEGRYEATGDLDDYEALKDEARAIKEAAVDRLPELVETVREAVEARGGEVYVADDAADAREYVRSIARERDVETAVKSKSMTSEEMEFNEALAADGVDVWETDLGEFVVQLAEEAPSHIVAPAIHRTREEIATLFDHHFDPEEPLETAEDLTRFAREFLAERYEEADLGMTGANFVAADTGTLALVTSEGNLRKTVAATDVHVAVAGVEKLVPSLAELPPFLELLSKSATGQPLTSYTTFLTPPGDAPTMDFDADVVGSAVPTEAGAEGSQETGSDGRSFHLVLLDNGRMAMREDDQLRETLYCVRCAACSNSCANFQHVGGHAFGGETYSGGIAGGWEAGVHGLDAAAEFNDLCTGCSRCVNACPVGIDVPWINTVVRDRINRGIEADAFDWLVDGLSPDAEPSGLDVQKRLFGNYETLARLGSATAPLSNWVADSRVGTWAMARLGVDPRREFPAFRRRTLRDWFEARGGSQVAAPEREVVLYPDVYTNYVEVERGKAAVRVLEALDVAVRLPAVRESGRAPLSQGMIATATEQAESVIDTLAPHLDADRDVVVVEPSDLAMFRREYGKLVDDEGAERLADASYEALEYVHGLLENGAEAKALAAPPTPVTYHPHCQARTLGLAAHTVEVLERAGGDVTTTEAECCGMAGSFGYKAEYYELSVAVGESLVEEVEGSLARAEGGAIAASGTSCLAQLEELADREPAHPLELLDPVE